MFRIVEIKGHIRDYVYLRPCKPRDFKEKEMAQRWIDLHGLKENEIRYEIKEVNLKMSPQKKTRKRKGVRK